MPNDAVGALLGVADIGVGHWNSNAALSPCKKVYT